MSAYTILGKSVPAHYLSIATIASVVLVVIPKPWSASAKPEPKIDASSPAEEKFIKEYLAKHAK